MTMKELQDLKGVIIANILENIEPNEKPRRNSKKERANISFELVAPTVSPVVNRKIKFE
jgi:hypothetical protein